LKRHLPYLSSSGSLEALLIPLLVDRVRVGRLDVVRENGQPFSDWERRFAEACGKILSLTVRNGLEYARVAWLAEHDPLTGVGNRRQFDLALERELSRAQRYHRNVSLLLIDVDDFKQVNAHMGLSAGDDILRRIGAVLTHGARKGVDISCRIGGDEFAMILPEIGESAADELAQRLQREVLQATAPVWPVRFSYSISTYPHINPEQFRRHADFRLLDAKDQKNNCVCPTPNAVQ
jgi:diguanylate cyclase (GGDEF)-like protein